MKIVHLSTNDLSGGAARAAYRQHKGLERAGLDSLMLVDSRASDEPRIVAFQKPMDVLSVARRRVRQFLIGRDFKRYRRSRPSGLELFSDDRSPYASTVIEQLPECDVVNLHWIRGFVDYQTFLSGVLRDRPVVWTLHDLNPLTGGCHYGLGCERYVAHCGTCPQLGSTVPGDLSHDIWERKRRIFERIPSSKLHFVASSRWLADQVSRSSLLRGFPLHIIPCGLDLDDFAPRDRGKVRDLLTIPQDARVLLVVAEDLSNVRKGFALLVEALARCAEKIPKLLLLSVGQNKPAAPAAVRAMHLGSINNDRFLSMVYSAADLFAICSLEEAFGYTALEAMACGVPVVGHGVGGILDTVRNGVNGLTVPPNDVGALADAVAGMLSAPSRCSEMGEKARRIAVDEYSLELQARRYSELYATIALS